MLNQKHFFSPSALPFFLLCLRVCVCVLTRAHLCRGVCVCACVQSTCLCMHMCEIQKKISSVLFCHSMPLNMEPGCHQASPSNPPMSALQAPVFQVCEVTAMFIYRCWGFQIRSSCLHSNRTYLLSHLLHSQNHFVTVGV